MNSIQFAPTVETWTVRKPAVASPAGIVASQHHVASDIGARVLAEGGNAIDAAVTAGLAIGTVEPWMSGLGGGGFMVVYRHEEGRAYCVNFGMTAPLGIDPGAYPLAEGTDSDLFAWPAVVEDRNVVGPLAIAVPGFVAGHALALERFGTRSWAQAMAPAIGLAEAGVAVDWYATLKIASEARSLARDPETGRTYLPGGFVPAGAWGGPLPSIRLGRLADTLQRLAVAGPRDFYEGEIARAIAADAAALGSPLSLADLAAYQASVGPADTRTYRGAAVHAATGLSAGPTLHHSLSLLESRLDPARGLGPETYRAYADCLSRAYRDRLERLGHAAEPDAQTCTTHIGVVDAEGNVVSLTQTLLSLFGSKVMFPSTGMLMNNGIMWFDPRPGRPNSIAAGRPPLSNMCPTVAERPDGLRFAVGASGGRRIMPAVAQLLSFLVDFGLDVDAAAHQPRIDASGESTVLVDDRLGDEVRHAIAADCAITVAKHGVYPALFACPSVVARDESTGTNHGAAFVMSPWAKASIAG